MKTENASRIKTVLEDGNNHAAKMLSNFTGVEVQCNFIASDQYGPQEFKNLMKKIEKSTIITTDIVGQLDGKSYFLVNEEAWNYIANLGIRGNIKDSESFRQAFMLELDNIISAACIAKIADAFSLHIHGAAPLLQNSLTNSNNNVSQEVSQFPDQYVMVTEIVFDNNCIRPLFIWALDCQSLEHPKALSKATEKIRTRKNPVTVRSTPLKSTAL